MVASCKESDNQEAVDVSGWTDVVCIGAGNTETLAVTSNGDILAFLELHDEGIYEGSY